MRPGSGEASARPQVVLRSRREAETRPLRSPRSVAHSTSTGLSCMPASVVVGASATCTATVTDIAGSGQTTPMGTVNFTSSGDGAFDGGPCTLSGSGFSASCSVSYTASAAGFGTHTLTANYGGETSHGISAGITSLIVQPTAPTSKSQCKKRGWRNYPQFKNQGDCVSFVATHGKNQPG